MAEPCMIVPAGRNGMLYVGPEDLVGDHGLYMKRVGKKAAGNTLGVSQHLARPKVPA